MRSQRRRSSTGLGGGCYEPPSAGPPDATGRVYLATPFAKRVTEADPPGGRPETGDSEDLVVLLGRVAARDEAAFAALDGRTSAKLYGIIARILSRGHAGDDALQDAYMRIWEKAGDFDPAKGGLFPALACRQLFEIASRAS